MKPHCIPILLSVCMVAGSTQAAPSIVSGARGTLVHRWERPTAPAQHAVGPRLVRPPAAFPAQVLHTAAWLHWMRGPLRRDPVDRVLRASRALVGLRSIRWMDPSVPDECSGFVRTVFDQVGIDVLGAGPRYDENAVGAIWRLARERGAVHHRAPTPGDLVFFRETYDRNRDGLRNDGRTHIGIVEQVEPDGTVVFLHRIRPGVTRSRMNLASPRRHRAPGGERILNDYLRSAQRGYRAYVTGELFAGYASFAALAQASHRSNVVAVR